MKLIDELDLLEKAATPGPWKTDGAWYQETWLPQYLSGTFRPKWPDDLKFVEELRNAYPELRDTIRRQEAELAELRKDKERLDWLAADTKRSIQYSNSAGCWWACDFACINGANELLRLAIDAAMECESE